MVRHLFIETGHMASSCNSFPNIISGIYQFDGLVWDYSYSIANALELLQSCTKLSK